MGRAVDVSACPGLLTGSCCPTQPNAQGRETKPWPDRLVWEPSGIWIYDATHLTRARRVVFFAIVDTVGRRWIDTLVWVEETATQVQMIFEHAVESEGLLELLTGERLELAVDHPARPILLAVSDNAPHLAARPALSERRVRQYALRRPAARPGSAGRGHRTAAHNVRLRRRRTAPDRQLGRGGATHRDIMVQC